jgi:hypothetical protein
MDKPITKAQAIAAYDGNAAALARALGVSRQSVHKLKEGPLPERWTLKLRYVLLPQVFAEPAPPADREAA